MQLLLIYMARLIKWTFKLILMGTIMAAMQIVFEGVRYNVVF